jgi:hypothetical protein
VIIRGRAPTRYATPDASTGTSSSSTTTSPDQPPRPSQNVYAFDDAGRKLWTVEISGSNPASAYVEFVSEEPLILWNYACCRCTVNPENGKLLDVVFTK